MNKNNGYLSKEGKFEYENILNSLYEDTNIDLFNIKPRKSIKIKSRILNVKRITELSGEDSIIQNDNIIQQFKEFISFNEELLGNKDYMNTYIEKKDIDLFKQILNIINE